MRGATQPPFNKSVTCQFTLITNQCSHRKNQHVYKMSERLFSTSKPVAAWSWGKPRKALTLKAPTCPTELAAAGEGCSCIQTLQYLAQRRRDAGGYSNTSRPLGNACQESSGRGKLHGAPFLRLGRVIGSPHYCCTQSHH